MEGGGAAVVKRKQRIERVRKTGGLRVVVGHIGWYQVAVVMAQGGCKWKVVVVVN